MKRTQQILFAIEDIEISQRDMIENVFKYFQLLNNLSQEDNNYDSPISKSFCKQLGIEISDLTDRDTIEMFYSTDYDFLKCYTAYLENLTVREW